MLNRLAPLALAASLALIAGPPAALAEELPPVVQALQAAQGEDFDSALAELVAHAERDALVVAVLRDRDAIEALSDRSLVALCTLVREHRLEYTNPGLRYLLKHADKGADARRAAVLALGEVAGIADVSVLGDVVQEFPDEAARALVHVNDRSARNALRRGAGEDPAPAALAGLSLLGDGTALAKLFAKLESAGAEGEGAGKAEYIAGLLRWATGRDHPADVASWRAHLRRRALAERLGDEDNDDAQAAVDELVPQLKAEPEGELATDLESIVAGDHWPVFARDKAALSLGLGGVRGAQDTLLAVTANLQPGSLRVYAAEALGRMGDLSIAPTLVNMLVHDEDRDRITARRPTGKGEYFATDPALARTLYRLGVKGAVAPIIAVLAGEYRTRMHRDCIRALRELSGGEDFRFEPDAPKDVRAAAHARIAAWWAQERELIPLEPRADDPGWPGFREQVDVLIGKLGAFKFLHQLRAKNALIALAEPARPQLEAALGHENLHVRMGVTEVLRGARLRVSAPALARQLAVEVNPAARTKLLEALVICGRPGWGGRPVGSDAEVDAMAESVRSVLGARELEVRISAARALGTVGDPRVDVPRLIEAREEERNAAATFQVASSTGVLGLSVRTALPALIGELESNDVARREEGAAALAAAGLDLHGYDADASEDDRAAAVQAIFRAVFAGARP